MNRSLRIFCCAMMGLLMLPLTTQAETWFQEAKRIRREADVVEARSKSFEILPDCELTEKSVKAGATFKDKGERVIARHTQVRVELPVGKAKGAIVFKYRTRDVDYNGEPAWTGHWKEPWAVGYFNYTVTATYKGNVYVGHFKVGRGGVISSKSA